MYVLCLLPGASLSNQFHLPLNSIMLVTTVVWFWIIIVVAIPWYHWGALLVK